MQNLLTPLPPRDVRLFFGLLAAAVGLTAFTLLCFDWPSLHHSLLWNILLALAPAVAALWLARRQALGIKGPVSGVLWAAWLLMLPNAPYMLTDLIHMQNYSFNPGHVAQPQLAPWLGWLQILWAVAVGSLLGCLALDTAQRMVARRRGAAAGWAFAAIVSLLCGAGVYIGRFMRFNSWDVLTSPLSLLHDLAARVSLSAAAFCLLFTFAGFGGYYLFRLCRAGGGSPE